MLGEKNLVQNIMDIGIKIYSMTAEELDNRVLELRTMVGDSKQNCIELDNGIEIEIMVVLSRLMDDGKEEYVDELDRTGHFKDIYKRFN